MHQFSDSDTPDSDEGIRFKTDSTRNKETNRKAIVNRKRTKSRSRSLERRRNRRKRDDERNRDFRSAREKYRRRSYSRERRDKRKSKDRSSNKHERLITAKLDRSKRSASLEMKNDASKRKSIANKRESKSKSQDLDLNRPKETQSGDCKDKTTKVDLIQLKTADVAAICPDSPAIDSLEAFGPALPPNLLTKSENFNRDTSPSPKFRSKSDYLLRDSESSLEEDDFNNSASKKRDTRAFSKVSTSPVSSEDHDLVPEDADDETYPPICPDVQHKDIIEIEDSDVESEQADLKPNNSSFDNCIRLKGTEVVELPCQSIGPFLPEHLREHLLKNAEENGNTNISLSDDDDEIEEGEIVGPIMPGSKCSFSATQIALEERALQFKIDGLINREASDATIREDWMVSLPEAKTTAQMGLAGRQFRAKAGPDLSDRSAWTETPKEKESKQRSSTKEDNGAIFSLEAARLEIDERNTEQERLARKHHRKHRKKDRKADKSLLEMHQDKLKIKQTNVDDDGQQIRRPFNRDVDLKVNQFDDAQKKAIYKKAQLLDDRFSKGESKYL